MNATARHWLLDLGNTRLKLAPLDADGRAGAMTAHAHDGDADAIAALPLPEGEACTFASVAQEAPTTALVEALSRRFTRIARVRTQARFAGVRVAYAAPDKLGVDRFLALLGARAAHDAPALVVGVGTALTIDLVDGDGLHRGGRIAPSPTLMRAALHARSARLPIEGGAYGEFADDTDDALASGCLGAALALVERSHAQAAMLLNASPRVLLHGGGSDALTALLPDATHAPALVMDGLAAWVAWTGRDASTPAA